MLTAEQRRQRILTNSESRLRRLQEANRTGQTSDVPRMAPVSSPAPAYLLQKSEEEEPIPTITNNPSPEPLSGSSFFSTITSTMNMINKFTSSSSSSKIKPTIEVTKDTIIIDKQHILVLILGIFVGLLYSFYISSESNFFFLIYFTATICLLTSRYYMMQMKHRSNVLITTAMLSGFQPELMKKFLLIYTLLYDAWIIFAVYFVSFCLTHVVCSLF